MPDWIIVGAGSAGCVLANRLSEDPKSSVLLLEAGPPDNKQEIFIPAGFSALARSEVDWDFWTEPQDRLNGRRVFHPRGKTLGGCSSINAMIFQRGHRADFDHWRALGNERWGYDDVLPFFKKLENWEGQASPCRGQGGPLNVAHLRDPNPISRALVEAAKEAGLPLNPDYNAADSEGASLAQVNQLRGRRSSSAEAYLRPALKRPNLRVLTAAQATRILLEGRRAVAVAVRRNGREESITAERGIILSGGAFNSPHLLMLSGIGPAAHLKARGIDVIHDLPGVGQNLQDHLMVGIKYACTQPITLLNARKIGSLLRYLLLRRGPLTSNVGEFVSFLRSRPELPGPDLEIVGAPVFYDILRPPTVHAFSIAAVLLQPQSVGQVRLASSNPLEKPLIEPNYLTDRDGADLRLLIRGVHLSRQIAAAKPLDPFRGDELVPGPVCSRADNDMEAFIRSSAETIYHPAGTCKMGTDAVSVVDPQLRVHGIDRLRVVDASIMPSIVRAHPHATVVMIAEKAADSIRHNRD